ncbi:MAG: STAS domain-containing protein [Sulfitobacter sp.]
MDLTAKTEETLTIISVNTDRIDAAVAIQFKDAMRAHTADGPDTVVVDLASVNFIDSSGLGAIVASMKNLGPARKLVLAGLTPTVDKVFRLTRMDTVMSLYSTLDRALDDLRG